MKNAIVIFLIFIYAFSTTGVALKADYCCNNLKSVKLILADNAKDKEGCCKVKYQSIKIKDVHAPADILATSALHFTFIHTLNSVFELNDLVHEQNNLFVNIHAPPLYPTTPLYNLWLRFQNLILCFVYSTGKILFACSSVIFKNIKSIQ
jgi:hypothetical protein